MKKTYRVELARRVIDGCYVEVEAESEDEAEEKALDYAHANYCDWSDGCTDEIWFEDLVELEPCDPRDDPHYEA